MAKLIEQERAELRKVNWYPETESNRRLTRHQRPMCAEGELTGETTVVE